ncbi:hypothetical protein JR316_0005447 [Psilocybe cubensis]|uniref:Transmembrane protein n=2 Tax=Psilocybe cubensis TaxID=181762 RepID=A0A8H7XJ47_PSICU|nr:hypothetical protein JR316_0005447 [Psilocybe cubensis]KAH9483341.1 hypothetical protein JR316_0005447 [Psilocybe cubensis]
MSLPDTVIIDDSDPSVVYEEGKWVTDTSSLNYTVNGRPFNNTVHTTFQRAFFTITFQGNEIDLWGLSSSPDVWVDHPDVEDARLASDIPYNGSLYGVSTVPVSNWSPTFGVRAAPREQPRFRFCVGYYQSVGWVSGTIYSLRVTVNGTEDNPVSFDFARFAPAGFSKPEEMTTGVMEYIFHSNGGYGGNNEAHPEDWENPYLFNITTSDAPYTFNFTGTSVAGLGGNGINDSHIPAMASYSIDGGDPANFTVNNLATSVLNTIKGQTIFQTHQVPPGDHSIKIVYHGNSTTTPLSLSSLLVTGAQRILSVDPPPPGQSSSSMVPQPSPTTRIPPIAHHKASPRGGISRIPVIAISISVCIVVALLCFIGFLLYRRRQRRLKSKRFSSYSIDPGPVAMAIVPFLDYSAVSLLNEDSDGEVSKNTSFSIPGESQAQAGALVETQRALSPLPASLALVRVVTRVHEDSGLLPFRPEGQVVVVDIPPSYTSLGDQAQREDVHGEVVHLLKPCPSYDS